MLPSPDDWRGAVAIIDAGGAFGARPVAFVFLQGGDSLAWVEPAYADPAGSAAPATHGARVIGPDESGRGIRCAGDGWTATLLPYDAADHRDLVGDAMEWFAAWLKAEGRTWAQERARVAGIMALEN